MPIHSSAPLSLTCITHVSQGASEDRPASGCGPYRTRPLHEMHTTGALLTMSDQFGLKGHCLEDRCPLAWKKSLLGGLLDL